MSFDEVRRDWTRLGEEDPLWAVHVATDKRDGRWDVDDFLELGVRDVAIAREWLQRLELPTTWQRVLDFGCGAGRLSQALAQHADEVVGVDVAEPMLATARKLDRTGGKCRFVHNERPDLRLFGDGEFDMAYSELVLQHLPIAVIDGYLAEFMRVLRPGGVAVLQCTTSPLWTLKGAVWRFAPYKLVAFAQRTVLKYPAPMRMTALAPDHLKAVVGTYGGEVVDSITEPVPATHWKSTRYVVRKSAS
jgi:ubiquinone/menaquinone biosynthesis C-methylase UbiE